MLLVTGFLYATFSLLAEYHYGIGFGSHAGTPMAAISHLDKAQALFPLEVRFRIGPAIGRSVVADVNGRPPGLVQWAVVALRRALIIDYTRADLLAQLVSFEAVTGETDQAERDYQRLKVLAPRSKFVIETEKQRQGGQ